MRVRGRFSGCHGSGEPRPRIIGAIASSPISRGYQDSLRVLE
jgi:hypothetical protein